MVTLTQVLSFSRLVLSTTTIRTFLRFEPQAAHKRNAIQSISRAAIFILPALHKVKVFSCKIYGFVLRKNLRKADFQIHDAHARKPDKPCIIFSRGFPPQEKNTTAIAPISIIRAYIHAQNYNKNELRWRAARFAVDKNFIDRRAAAINK